MEFEQQKTINIPLTAEAKKEIKFHKSILKALENSHKNIQKIFDDYLKS